MKNFIIYNSDGKILRSGSCDDHSFASQVQSSKENILEGKANDKIQKVAGEKVVNKTPEEIKRDNSTPPEIPFEKQTANITNEQWQDILDRLDKLEK